MYFEALFIFGRKFEIMGHDHKEAEQNEIGGPVLVAIIALAVVVIVIYLLGQ